MPSIDFAELKRRVSTAGLLAALGWHPTEWDESQSRGPCPIHRGLSGKSRSFWLRRSDGWWYCHGCKLGGGVVELALHLLAPTVPDACRELCRLVGVDVPYVPRSPANRQPRNRKRNGAGVRGAEPPGA